MSSKASQTIQRVVGADKIGGRVVRPRAPGKENLPPTNNMQKRAYSRDDARRQKQSGVDAGRVRRKTRSYTREQREAECERKRFPCGEIQNKPSSPRNHSSQSNTVSSSKSLLIRHFGIPAPAPSAPGLLIPDNFSNDVKRLCLSQSKAFNIEKGSPLDAIMNYHESSTTNLPFTPPGEEFKNMLDATMSLVPYAVSELIHRQQHDDVGMPPVLNA